MDSYEQVQDSDRYDHAWAENHRPHNQSYRRRDRVHWQAPSLMIGCCILGLVFAIAHDRFYHAFDGHVVSSGLEQKVITTAGTAFAFLVKTFFALSGASVFSQQLWYSLGRRAETINDIDALFDILGNAFQFRRLSLLFRHFVLAIIALVVWCVPIAAVFTPGLINVQRGIQYDYSASLRPAQPQQSWIGTQNFGQTQIDFTALTSDGVHTYAYALLNGPSAALYSVALATVSSRTVLSITPSNTNCSYDLSFFGPALSCESLPSGNVSDFEKTVAAAQKNAYLPGQHTILGGVESIYNDTGLVLKYNAWVATRSTGYSLLKPNWNNDTINASPDQTNNEYFYFSSNTSSILLACHLRNATYNTSFHYENGDQTIKTTSLTLHEPIPLNTTVDTENPDYANPVYNAVYYAFNNIVIGAAINDTVSVSPNVLYYGGPVLISALRDFIEGDTPLTASAAMNTLQTMFQNITISTLSSPLLRLPDDQAQSINGSTWEAVNVYVYQPRDLYIAYGSALLPTILCALWGLYLVFWKIGTTYSMKFSTTLRTTRDASITKVVGRQSKGGSDPLPAELATVGLRLHGVNEHENEHRGFVVEDKSGLLQSREMQHVQRVGRKPVPTSEIRLVT